jgi:glycogen(starch) synthase
MKHVCLIGPIPPPWGGVETHMMTLRDHLRANGWRCSIINVTRHRQPEHDDLYFPASPKDVLQTLRRLAPDVVHVHFGGKLFTRQALLFVVLSMRRRAKNVFTFHSGGFPTSEEGMRARWWSLRGFALRRLDAVIGVNRELVRTFASYGVRASRLHLIEPHTIGLNRAEVVREPLPENIATFADAHDPFLVTVAQLEPEYGIDVQIDAFSAIRGEFPNAGLAIIGGGTLHERIAARIADHPEREHIVLCGNLPRPKTLAVMARAALMLRTTHYDGDALSIREALEIGTPVLATDNGMRPAGVVLLSTLDPGALAAAIGPALATRGFAVPDSEAKANPMEVVVALYKTISDRR